MAGVQAASERPVPRVATGFSPSTMRGRRLPLNIQIFYCARPDQEPFVKVGGTVSSVGRLGALSQPCVLKSFWLESIALASHPEHVV